MKAAKGRAAAGSATKRSPPSARASPPSGSKASTPTWPEIMRRKTQFERDCARDSLTSQLPEDLRKIMWELITNPAKIQGASSLIARSVLAEAPLVKKKRGVKAVDDANAQHWDIDKNSQIPKYWLWECIKSKAADGTVTEAFIERFDKKDRAFIRKIVEAVTQLRPTYKILEQMKDKRLAGRIFSRLYGMNGSRWPALYAMLVGNKLEWSENGVFSKCEPDGTGRITHIKHISGKVAEVPRSNIVTEKWWFEENWSDRFARCTDGDGTFLCYTRFQEEHKADWFMIASDPAATLRQVAADEEKKLDADIKRVAVTDVVISKDVADAAEGAKRRRVSSKGPPIHKMMMTAPTPSASSAPRRLPIRDEEEEDLQLS